MSVVRSVSREADHCVLIATLVEPRMTPDGSANWTKTRLFAGSNGTVPEPLTKIPKVGVALAAIVVVTLGPIGDMQEPLVGSV